jgi:8-amino-7-oxononanoate synthase
MLELVLAKRLTAWEKRGLLRTLGGKTTSSVDLVSNDYLGLARCPQLREIFQRDSGRGEGLVGSTGSRLLSGNSADAEAAERQCATFFQAPAGLLFSSGYAANVGLLSCVAQRTDTVLYDEFVHASTRDGIRLSGARAWAFRHNDAEELRERCARASGNIFIVVESLYSMDGDYAPLSEIGAIAREFGAAVIVDEAHSTGICGVYGEGCTRLSGVADVVLARVHTFGKAMGVHGAVVVGSDLLRSYLINFARSFIYSTAPSPDFYGWISASLERCRYADLERAALRERVNCFRELSAELVPGHVFGDGPIQIVRVSGAGRVRQIGASVRDLGYDCRAILAPTVREGDERLRVCLHAYDDMQMYEQFLRVVGKALCA